MVPTDQGQRVFLRLVLGHDMDVAYCTVLADLLYLGDDEVETANLVPGRQLRHPGEGQHLSGVILSEAGHGRLGCNSISTLTN